MGPWFIGSTMPPNSRSKEEHRKYTHTDIHKIRQKSLRKPQGRTFYQLWPRWPATKKIYPLRVILINELNKSTACWTLIHLTWDPFSTFYQNDKPTSHRICYTQRPWRLGNLGYPIQGESSYLGALGPDQPHCTRRGALRYETGSSRWNNTTREPNEAVPMHKYWQSWSERSAAKPR